MNLKLAKYLLHWVSIQLIKNHINMKPLLLITLCASLFILTTSTTQAPVNSHDLTLLKGTWVFKDRMGETGSVYKRSKKLNSSWFGMVIEDDGKFTIRTKSRSCVRTNENFSSIEGSWKMTGDDTFEIEYQCDLAKAAVIHEYKIIEVTKKKLTFDIVESFKKR